MVHLLVHLLVHLCPRCFDRHRAGGLCALVAAQLDVPVAAAAAALRHRLGVLHQHQPTPGREGMRGPVTAMVLCVLKDIKSPSVFKWFPFPLVLFILAKGSRMKPSKSSALFECRCCVARTGSSDKGIHRVRPDDTKYNSGTID